MSLYNEIYQTIITMIYNGSPNAYGEWVATLFSTGACIFALSLPLIVVWKIICFITGR